VENSHVSIPQCLLYKVKNLYTNLLGGLGRLEASAVELAYASLSGFLGTPFYNFGGFLFLKCGRGRRGVGLSVEKGAKESR